MDVYGYPPYQYPPSDELAKQLYAKQTLGASVVPCHGVAQPHLMPVPTGSRWTGQSLPWSMESPPQLVQFTAQTHDADISPIIHCKRKSLDPEPVIPSKQFITEEKMAAHLNSLHISSDYTQHSLANDDVMEIAMEGPLEETPHNMCAKLKGHTIVLSDAVKQIKEEPLLPAALIERLQKPQMSLVVWKPRENIIEKIKEDKENENSEESHKKRHGVLVLDQSKMAMEI